MKIKAASLASFQFVIECVIADHEALYPVSRFEYKKAVGTNISNHQHLTLSYINLVFN